jgi:hypothetical protein
MPGEALAAASNTFNRTNCPECGARTRATEAAGRVDRAQAPKMPGGIRKTNSNTPFGGEGTGIFP